MSRIQTGIILLVLAGLSFAGQARGQSDHTANLIEGAKKEQRVVWYTSLNLTESKILFDAFQKKYPYVQPETFRATAETTLNRILTETRAGRWEFDAVGMSQVGTLAHYKVLAPYVSPEAGAYISEFKDPAGYWTGYSSNYYTLGYNTKLVSPNEAPRSWEDLLDAKWKGKISIDREEYAWYAALLEAWGKEKTHRFMEALARQNVQWRKGPVLIAQLMAAGGVSDRRRLRPPHRGNEKKRRARRVGAYSRTHRCRHQRHRPLRQT